MASGQPGLPPPGYSYRQLEPGYGQMTPPGVTLGSQSELAPVAYGSQPMLDPSKGPYMGTSMTAIGAGPPPPGFTMSSGGAPSSGAPTSAGGLYVRNPDARTMRSMHTIGTQSAARLAGAGGTQSKLTMLQASRASMGASRSLRASKASMATTKSAKSSIQQEYHDIKVQKQVRSLRWGQGSVPFRYAIVFLILAFILGSIGLVLMLLRFHQIIILTVNRSEVIGPLFFAGSALSIAVALRLIWDSYKLSNMERERLRFHAASATMVSMHLVARQTPESNIANAKAAGIKSGTATSRAVTRTPVGSRTNLNP